MLREFQVNGEDGWKRCEEGRAVYIKCYTKLWQRGEIGRSQSHYRSAVATLKMNLFLAFTLINATFKHFGPTFLPSLIIGLSLLPRHT